MWFILFVITAAVWSQSPMALELTEAENTALQANEMVIRESAVGSVIGIVHIKAPPRVVLEEVVNLQARVEEVSLIDDIELYIDENDQKGVRWEVSMVGIDVQFHVLYQIDWENGWCSFDLDPTKENSISASSGSYKTEPIANGTRLYYRSHASSSNAAPSWVRKTLTQHSMKQQINGIKARAEARN